MKVTNLCTAPALAAALGVCLVLTQTSLATIPYSGAGGPFPGFGPGVQVPLGVGGKEYSHDRDHEVLFPGPPNTAGDAQQVVAWDGAPGASGVVNVTDYTGTRPNYTPDDQIDALANVGDFAYVQLKDDRAHLVFSVDDSITAYLAGAPTPFTVPSAGPVVLSNGNMIGGAGELSVELCASAACAPNPADTQMLWASQLDINGMPDAPDLTDVDGVEVWGPEPPLADANKYSLDIDILGGTSVWNASGTTYIAQPTIVSAVTSLLGPNVEPDDINLDALMVRDVIGDDDTFERNPTGGPGGDEIIFSIRQIVDPSDADGYYATGSELFVLNADMTVSFLSHGGHLWDHAYALTAFLIPGGTMPGDDQYGAYDINAIEAIGEFAVPEPATGALLLSVGALAAVRRRR